MVRALLQPLWVLFALMMPFGGGDADAEEVADMEADVGAEEVGPAPAASTSEQDGSGSPLNGIPLAVITQIAGIVTERLSSTLSNMVAAAVAERTYAGATASKKSTVANRPKPWDGSSHTVADFLASMRIYLESTCTPSADWVRVLATYLPQSRVNHLFDQVRRDPDLPPSFGDLTWDQACDFLHQSLHAVDPQTTVRARLTKLRLLPGKASIYSTEMDRILAELRDDVYKLGPIDHCGFIMRSLKHHHTDELYREFLIDRASGKAYENPSRLLSAIVERDNMAYTSQLVDPADAVAYEAARQVVLGNKPKSDKGKAPADGSPGASHHAAADHKPKNKRKFGTYTNANAGPSGVKDRTKDRSKDTPKANTFVEPEVWEMRKSLGRCERCGSADHKRIDCPKATPKDRNPKGRGTGGPRA
jgi:hypothetical protein